MKDGGNLVMSLLTVPMICQPLSAQPISLARDKYEHLCEMDLADFSNGDDNLEIDVLIGSDHYCKLVTGGVVQGSGGQESVGCCRDLWKECPKKMLLLTLSQPTP